MHPNYAYDPRYKDLPYGQRPPENYGQGLPYNYQQPHPNKVYKVSPTESGSNNSKSYSSDNHSLKIPGGNYAYQQHYGQMAQGPYGYPPNVYPHSTAGHSYSINDSHLGPDKNMIDQNKGMIPKANSVSDILTLNTKGAINSSMVKGIYFSDVGESRHFSDDTQILNSLGQPIIPAKRFVTRRKEYDTTSLAPDAVKRVDHKVFRQDESEFIDDSITNFVTKK